MKKYLAILISILIFYSCSDTTGPTKPAKDIDDLVRNAGVVNTSVVTEKDEKVSEETQLNVLEGVKKWNIKLTKKSLAWNLDNNIIPFNNPNANTLWAGALVQGNEVPNGILNSIGDNLSRTPLTITVQSGSGNLGNNIIEKPSNANYSKVLQDILDKNVTKCTAKQYLTVQIAHSKQQACIKLGFSANWLTGSLSTNFETNNSSEQKSIYLLFKQVYFTVSVNEPTKPSDYFGDNIKLEDLNYFVKPNNPLCYVASVDYGRLILVKMTYNENITSTELDAKVKLAFSAYEVGGDYKTTDIESKSTFECLILGGSNGGAAKALGSMNLNGILDLIKAESEYTPNTPAYPISYVVKNLADNSIVKLGESTEYTVKEYTENREDYQTFDFYLSQFNIIDDGNFWGDGKFFYKIQIIDKNGNLLKDVNDKDIIIQTDKFNYIKVGDGGKITLTNGIIKGVALKKQSGEQFTVSAQIWDYDADTDLEIHQAGKQGNIYNYPSWNNDFNNWIYMNLVPDAGDYNIQFIYRIEKK
ncbi:MAG: hypothetical protein A2475_01170 [Ignavibacteria bacterium RIFOXYC2_FULL_35_21]|nr:MAG: hypothetical protein A2220_01875 [Ignavibacteria bacterium RIFOXYA2_FULL_35_10]OGV21256.1 MAG: hypothetical protein A2475_01170 [Ignavibacteria bacterium RIFOXYC2_FULL_35_21]